MPSSRQQRKTLEAVAILLEPVSCASALLNTSLVPLQQTILRSVATHPRTAVKSCHASGKTFEAAVAVAWWLITHPNGIAVTTAPTQVQVQRVLWGEIHALVRRAKFHLPQPSATELRLGPNRYAIGLSTNEGVRFQGFHGDVLIVIDEAPGVLSEIYQAIESVNPYPYLTRRRWVKEKFYEWGPGHPLWQSRVLGEFPTQAEDALLSLTSLEQAKLRTEGDGDVCAGIDVAGPGEAETVFCVRRGPKIVLIKAWTKSNAWGDVVVALLPFKSELKSVNVDVVGIGEGMARHLENEGFPVININAGSSARDKTKCVSLKAEIYWHFRGVAESGQLAGLSDELTIIQLLGIRYSHNPKGQIVIESKEEARKRGVKSPDRAEAVILAFAQRELSLGLIDYLRQETEALAAQETNETTDMRVPLACSKCGSPNLSLRGYNWLCACGEEGSILNKLTCPKCGSEAVARIGPESRCSQCGHQWASRLNRGSIPAGVKF